MTTRLNPTAVFALALGLLLNSASAGDLTIGDPAPKLAVGEFVKGEPVKGFEKGKTYVVEFWATWCGPCKTSIPHLTELQAKHKDATFIGVSVSEQDFANVKPFVKEMGDKMNYRVAIDSVPEGKDAEDGVMGKTWMEASGQAGIPAAFVVNGDGKIAWIGHPMELEKPLEKILAGSWDLAAAREKLVADKAREAKLEKLMTAIQDSFEKGPKPFLAALRAAETEGVTLPPFVVVEKLKALAASADTKPEAITFAKELIDKTFKGEPMLLNALASSLVEPETGKVDPELAKIGLKAANRADELAEKKEPAFADTLAKSYFVTGDLPKAIETQERAIKLAEANEDENLSVFKSNLEKYRRAAKQAGAK